MNIWWDKQVQLQQKGMKEITGDSLDDTEEELILPRQMIILMSRWNDRYRALDKEELSMRILESQIATESLGGTLLHKQERQ